MTAARKPSVTVTTVDPLALPLAFDWQLCLGEDVYDVDGTAHTFGDLIAGDSKVLVIFIRHFWCGLCQSYISQLSSSLPPPSPSFRTIVIGCGSHLPIASYLDMTGSKLPTYANPSLSLYDFLGFGSTLEMGPRGLEKGQKEYAWAAGPVWEQTLETLKRVNLKHTGKTGPISQNGGELLIENGSPSYIHRMVHTADHLDLPDLFTTIGLDPSTVVPAPPRRGSKPTDESRRSSNHSRTGSKSSEERRSSWFSFGRRSSNEKEAEEKGEDCGCGSAAPPAPAPVGIAV